MTACIDFRATYATPIPADGALPFELTAQEREAAAFAQAQLRFDARMSPHGKPAGAGVTAAKGDGEGRDRFTEARIRVIGSACNIAMLKGDDAAARRIWTDYKAAHAARSPEVVAEMEAAMR